MLVDSLGLTPAMDQNIDVHTNGTAVVGTNTVNGAGQQGSTITVAALNGTVTRGTKVTFAGVCGQPAVARLDGHVRAVHGDGGPPLRCRVAAR
jgi:hypothetical protein